MSWPSLVKMCSGVWPYTRLILLGAWFYTPPKRGQILEWIGAGGEVGAGRHLRDDAMLVAFHFDVTVGDTTGDIKAAVSRRRCDRQCLWKPCASFFVYVLASCLSVGAWA